MPITPLLDKKFMESNTYEQNVNSYDKRDYRSLFGAAHSYKGVAGILPLTPLYEIASTITKLARNNDNVNLDNEIQEFKTKYSLIKEKYFEYIVK